MAANEPRPATPPPREFGPAWRIVLAVAMVAAGGMLLAFWPALHALGLALTAWSGQLALLAVVFVAGALALALWMLLALALRLMAHARQAAIILLPGGLQAHVGDVKRQKRRQTLADDARWAMEQHFAVELADRQRPTPLLTSQNLHIHNVGVPALTEEAAPALPGPPPFDPRKTVFEQLLTRGDIDRSGRSLLVGYDASQAPQYIEMDSCSFVIVGGQPRAGKTSTVKLLLAQAAYMGWHIAVADMHAGKESGLLRVCQPISGAFIKQATTADEIAHMIRWVDKIGQRRLDGDKIDAPVLLVVDEYSNLVLRKLLPPDVLALVPAMAMAYAGVQVHGMIIGHDFSASLLGGALGTSLRRATTHRIVHKIAPDAAELILPSAAVARQAANLESGGAIYWGEGSPSVVAVPWIEGNDLIVAARGRPPKPYAPRPQLAAAHAPPPIPPTARVAPAARQPAPPTAPMNITVPEQILDLLRARGYWMTASEIAAALQVDEHVIRTEIKELYTNSQLARRPCQGRTTKERYEYSHSTNQRVNQSTALSA